MSESAICAMTETWRGAKKRLNRPIRAGSPTCCFKSFTRSALVASSAGPRLKSIVARRENKNVTASTAKSGRNLMMTEKLTDESKPWSCCRSKSLHQELRTRPTAPPKIASRKPSQSNCLTIRQRDAPTARRTAISFERDVPRARSILARFRQAMSKTAPAMNMSKVAINVIGPSSSGCVLMLKRDGF